MSFINYNGLIYTHDEAILFHDNHAFRYGEGLIETMLLQDGTIPLAALHFNRLQQSLTVLGMELSWTMADLVKESVKVSRANDNAEQGIIRLQVFREVGEGQCGFLIACSHLVKTAPDNNWPGLNIGISQNMVKSADLISSLKTTSRLAYIMAKKEADQNGWNDVLLVNQYGRIVESTISNVFCIKGNEVFTPPLSEGCIAGVFRQYLLEATLPDNMIIKEKALTVADVEQADEVFLTNAVRGIQPVQVIGSKVYANALTRLIFEATKL